MGTVLIRRADVNDNSAYSFTKFRSYEIFGKNRKYTTQSESVKPVKYLSVFALCCDFMCIFGKILLSVNSFVVYIPYETIEAKARRNNI